MKLFFNFPSKSRPQKCLASLDNITSLIKSNNYQIIVTADIDDNTMCNDEMRDKINSFPNTKVIYGTSKGKVDAINKNIGLADIWDICLVHSDDMVFLKKGFDNDIREAFADGFRGLLHIPDGRVKYMRQDKHAIGFAQWVVNKHLQQPEEGGWKDNYNQYVLELNQRLITYPIMHVDYYRKFNYIYSPEYTSVFCDEEQQSVAKQLRQYKYVDKQIFEHQHYRHGFGQPDELMLHNDSEKMYLSDKAVYHKRLTENFGLNK